MARNRAAWLRIVFAALPLGILLGAGALALPDDHGQVKPAAKPAANPPAPKPSGEHSPADNRAPADHKPAAEPAAPPTPAKPAAKPALDHDHDDTAGNSRRVDAPKPPSAPNAGGAPERAPKRPGPSAETPADADAALRSLKDGNIRWVEDRCESPNVGPSRRETLARDGQKPFASILTCADSRLPVERLFDRGVGELFVVRVAGNIAGTSETGTLEYGVEHLHIPLLVVMGHSKCGAVAAAVGHAKPAGALGELVERIGPAVQRAEGQLEGATPDAVTGAAIKENVWQTIFDLIRSSPEIRAAITKGELKVVGAVCDVGTGKVEFMGEHPWQADLVAAFNARHGTAPASAHAEEGH